MPTQSYIAAVLLLGDPNTQCPDNISRKIWGAMKKRIAAGQAFLAPKAGLVLSHLDHVQIAEAFAGGGTVAEVVEAGADAKIARQIFSAWKSVGHTEPDEKGKVTNFAEAKKTAEKAKKDTPRKPYQYQVLKPLIDGIQAFADDFMSRAVSPDSLTGVKEAYTTGLLNDVQHLSELSAPLQEMAGARLRRLELKGFEYAIRKDPATGITRLTFGVVVDKPGKE